MNKLDDARRLAIFLNHARARVACIRGELKGEESIREVRAELNVLKWLLRVALDDFSDTKRADYSKHINDIEEFVMSRPNVSYEP